VVVGRSSAWHDGMNVQEQRWKPQQVRLHGLVCGRVTGSGLCGRQAVVLSAAGVKTQGQAHCSRRN
jgi:hypothetical protein